jgi:hypothetical protein
MHQDKLNEWIKSQLNFIASRVSTDVNIEEYEASVETVYRKLSSFVVAAGAARFLKAVNVRWALFDEEDGPIINNLVNELVNHINNLPSSRRLDTKRQHSEEKIDGMELIETAFSLPYIRTDVVRDLYDRLALHCEQSTTTFYSPYTALINSSMMGKSRAMVMLKDYGVFIFYFCLRESRSSGFPRRSKEIADKFKILKSLRSRDSTTGISVEGQKLLEISAILISCIECLDNWLLNHVGTGELSVDNPSQNVRNRLCNEWYDHQRVTRLNVTADSKAREEELTFCGRIIERAGEVANKLKDIVKPIGLSNNTIETVSKNEFQRTLYQVKSKLKEKYAIDSQGLDILFAFDETRSLLDNEEPDELSSFHYFRKALRIMIPSTQKVLNVFTLMTDTTSKISNLVPRVVDPSERMLPITKYLHQPIFALNTLDVHLEELGSASLRFKVLTPKSEFCLFGRPGLKFVASTPNSIPLLIQKLLCDNPANMILHSSTILSDAQALAVVSSRVCLSVVSWGKLPSDLVSGHMSLCTGISRSREQIFIFRPMEPALAFASACLTSIIGWSNLIKSLNSMIADTAVEGGSRGEIAAQLVMLMTMDSVSKLTYELQVTREVNVDETSMKSVRVREFLDSLLGPARSNVADNVSEEKYKQLDQWIRVYQFVPIYSTVTADDLVTAFNRFSAFVCKRCNPGCDLIIPVFCGEEGEEVRKDRMSYIGIQVKNWQSRRQTPAQVQAATVEGLLPDQCGITGLSEPCKPRLGLYMNFGIKKKPQVLPHLSYREDYSNYFGVSIETVRVDHMFNESVQDALDDLVRSEVFPYGNTFSESLVVDTGVPRNKVIDDHCRRNVYEMLRDYKIPMNSEKTTAKTTTIPSSHSEARMEVEWEEGLMSEGIEKNDEEVIMSEASMAGRYARSIEISRFDIRNEQRETETPSQLVVDQKRKATKGAGRAAKGRKRK